MFPRFTPDHGPNGRNANSKLASNLSDSFLTGGHQFPKRNHLFSRELRPPILLSGVGFPPFGIHVVHIVGVCSYKQVLRIATRRIVAMMKAKFSKFNRSVSKLVRNSMSRNVCSVSSKPPIMVIPPSRSPWPTFRWISFFNLLPEAFSKWFSNCHEHTQSVISGRKSQAIT